MQREKGLVILEGPDACGKTTLAKHLVDKYHGHYIHCEGKRFDDMFNYQTEALVEATELCDECLVVIDRLWPSEIAYANVFRGGTKFPYQQRLMDRIIRKHAGFYVFCVPEDFLHGNFAPALARHKRNIDPDHPYDEDSLTKVHDQYARIYTTMCCRPDVLKYHLEFHGNDLNCYSDMLIRDLKFWQDRQFKPLLRSDYKSILGHLSGAKYLLVGEELNPKDDLKWPFYEHGNCSAFLCKALDEAGIDDTKLMISNALDSDFRTPTYLSTLIKRHSLHPVALGKRAFNVLANMVPKVVSLPHPQFMRRFHHNNGEFVKLLKETLK